MSLYNTSPNMNLLIPIQGEQIGPQYALDVNASFVLVDGHDHSSGKGVPITPSGLNINSDLPFNGNNLTLIRSARLSSQNAVLAGASDLNCIYTVGVDLYYNDGNGNHVRITQSGGVAGSPGSIANLTSPASAAYVSASSKFVWQSAANTAADLDCRSVILRNAAASSKGLTLNPPAAMGANYSLTLPSLPGAQSFMTVDASGAMATPIAYIGGIVPANLAAANTGSSSTIFTSGSGAATTVLGTATITTVGRPVRVELEGISASESATPSGILVQNNQPITVFVSRDGTIINTQLIGSSTSTYVYYPTTVINFTDYGAGSGSHTYAVAIYAGNAGCVWQVNTAKLYLMEI